VQNEGVHNQFAVVYAVIALLLLFMHTRERERSLLALARDAVAWCRQRGGK
jgi:hypothetical protein